LLRELMCLPRDKGKFVNAIISPLQGKRSRKWIEKTG